MAASEKSLEKVKALEADRHRRADVKHQWENLVKEYDQEKGTKTPADPKGPELKALIDALALFLDEKSEGKDETEKKERDEGCPEDDPCSKKKKPIDLEVLAEKVFLRLMFEVRIERERTGWAG